RVGSPRAGRSDQFGTGRLALEQLGDSGQGSQVLPRGTFGSHHAEDDAHLRAVDRIEVDARWAKQQGGDVFLDCIERGVRDGNALAYSGALEFLPVLEPLGDLLRL